MRVPQPEGKRGSLKWIQRLVNEHAEMLNVPLRQAGALLAGSSVEWVSPRVDDDRAEYRDDSFLDRLGFSRLSGALREFWPTRGPQWDALGRSEGAVFLVEAKAHRLELVSTCTARSTESRTLIERSLRETRTAIGARADADWLTGCYQLANRLAHLHFLRSQGVEAYLVLVYFVGDVAMRGPASREGWQVVLAQAHHQLGLEAAPSVPGLVEVFIDVAGLGSPSDRPESSPGRVETHPAGYAYRERFPSLHEVFGGEGGAVYAADGPEGAAVISEESTVGFLLADEDAVDTVTIQVFPTREARDAFVAQTYGSTP